MLSQPLHQTTAQLDEHSGDKSNWAHLVFRKNFPEKRRAWRLKFLLHRWQRSTPSRDLEWAKAKVRFVLCWVEILKLEDFYSKSNVLVTLRFDSPEWQKTPYFGPLEIRTAAWSSTHGLFPHWDPFTDVLWLRLVNLREDHLVSPQIWERIKAASSPSQWCR